MPIVYGLPATSTFEAAERGPTVLSLEVRRLEKETVKRLQELRDVFGRNPQEARKVIEHVLDGKLTFTPIETAEGKRYRVEGRATPGEVLQIPAYPEAPYCLRPGKVRVLLVPPCSGPFPPNPSGKAAIEQREIIRCRFFNP